MSIRRDLDYPTRVSIQRMQMKRRGKKSLFWLGHWWFFEKPKDVKGGTLLNEGLHNKRWILINNYLSLIFMLFVTSGSCSLKTSMISTLNLSFCEKTTHE